MACIFAYLDKNKSCILSDKKVYPGEEACELPELERWLAGEGGKESGHGGSGKSRMACAYSTTSDSDLISSPLHTGSDSPACFTICRHLSWESE